MWVMNTFSCIACCDVTLLSNTSCCRGIRDVPLPEPDDACSIDRSSNALLNCARIGEPTVWELDCGGVCDEVDPCHMDIWSGGTQPVFNILFGAPSVMVLSGRLMWTQILAFGSSWSSPTIKLLNVGLCSLLRQIGCFFSESSRSLRLLMYVGISNGLAWIFNDFLTAIAIFSWTVSWLTPTLEM